MSRIIDSDSKNLIGKNLRKLRIKYRMSQQEVSAKLEIYGIYVCRGSISRVEDMSRTVTDIELLGFSKVFGVPIDAFFDK